jgi:hypothetical protein
MEKDTKRGISSSNIRMIDWVGDIERMMETRIKRKYKCKVVPVLNKVSHHEDVFLIKYYAMKMYGVEV